jgi:signal transduction histidine kinase
MIVLLHNEATRYTVSVRPNWRKAFQRLWQIAYNYSRCLMNLMLHAVESMKDTIGELTIRSQLSEDSQLLISVRDTAVTLPTEKADQTFDAFSTTKPQGTGIGLAITRSIVDSHGGRFWASANSGRSAFHFTLSREIEAHA